MIIKKNYSIAIGSQDTITGLHAVSVGYETKISSNYRIGIGEGATVANANAIAIG